MTLANTGRGLVKSVPFLVFAWAISCAVPGYGDVIDETAVLAAMAKPGRLAADIERDQNSKPQFVIPLLMLEPGDRVVDIFGSGGYYSELLASVLGEQGEAGRTPQAAMASRPSRTRKARPSSAKPCSLVSQPAATATADPRPMPATVIASTCTPL